MMEYNVFKTVSFIQNASESGKESKKVIHKLQEDHRQLQYVCSAHASLTSTLNVKLKKKLIKAQIFDIE